MNIGHSIYTVNDNTPSLFERERLLGLIFLDPASLLIMNNTGMGKLNLFAGDTNDETVLEIPKLSSPVAHHRRPSVAPGDQRKKSRASPLGPVLEILPQFSSQESYKDYSSCETVQLLG